MAFEEANDFRDFFQRSWRKFGFVEGKMENLLYDRGVDLFHLRGTSVGRTLGLQRFGEYLCFVLVQRERVVAYFER